MMNKKMFSFRNAAIVAVFAMVAFIGFSAFKSTVSEVKPKAAPLYWYTVTYDLANPLGYISSSAAFVTQAEKGTFNPGCLPGNNLDCVRGFTTAITSYPEPGVGADQIKKP